MLQFNCCNYPILFVAYNMIKKDKNMTFQDLVKLPITFIDQFDVYILCMDVYFQNKEQIIDNILCDLYIN